MTTKRSVEKENIGGWLSGLARLAGGLDDEPEGDRKAKGMNPADVLVPPDQLARVFRVEPAPLPVRTDKLRKSIGE